MYSTFQYNAIVRELGKVFGLPKEEIDALETYCSEFLLDDVQNPGDGSVGVLFADTKSISSGTGHARAYPLVFNLYHTLYRVAHITGMTGKTGKTYLRSAARTIVAMFAHVPSADIQSVGIRVDAVARGAAGSPGGDGAHPARMRRGYCRGG